MVLKEVVFLLSSIAVAATLDRVLLPESDYGSGGRCLDGSMAGYYYEKPTSGKSSVVVINMAGGGACNTQASCQQRAKSQKGSSKNWATTMQTSSPQTKVLSTSQSENPDFYNAHHVHIPYCTGDVHSGQVVTPSAAQWGLYFSGHLNLQNIVDHLVKTVPAIGDAQRILLTGNSAGGYGTVLNCDYLQDVMTNKYKSSAKVSCAPLAGWFFPGFTDDQADPDLPPSDWAHWSKGQQGGLAIDAMVALWKTYLHPDCAKAKGTKAYLCGSATAVYPYIKAPFYAMENQYDVNQITSQLGLPRSSYHKPSGEPFVAYFGRAMRNSTALVYNHPFQKKGDGLFSASCLDHGGGLGVAGETKIKGYTCKDGLGDWFFGRGKVPSVLVDDCKMAEAGGPCNPTCGTAPSPSPGPSPTPSGCVAELMKVCGDKMSSKRACLSCAQSFRPQLKQAGCTVSEVDADCGGAEMPITV